ncbi:hypothetical protein J1N35_012454 [Gossypium stocksii]|uniref:Uncharacterized protein n=1 Tax=Gossypium stocksii TaxID=47602 RepID=A0A9D3W4B9_9ROSI|nr:hypothetical protein J1N35_012454 [Gossypium stocksii]
MCRAIVGKKVLGAILNHKIDVPKSKEFTRTRSASNMDNFLWGTEQYFHAKSIFDDATKRHKSIGEKYGGTTIRTLEEF